MRPGVRKSLKNKLFFVIYVEHGRDAHVTFEVQKRDTPAPIKRLRASNEWEVGGAFNAGSPMRRAMDPHRPPAGGAISPHHRGAHRHLRHGGVQPH
jgi:hypothetical protein